jgi:hypothetical protein
MGLFVLTLFVFCLQVVSSRVAKKGDRNYFCEMIVKSCKYRKISNDIYCLQNNSYMDDKS